MHKITKEYLLLFEKISNTSRQSRSFGTDVDIYCSEIHIIEIIGDRSELYISEISKLIGVTKGTVSQVVKRLVVKGLVIKEVDAANNTRLVVRLTNKGQVAYEAHERYHYEQHAEMERYLQSLNVGQIETLETFLGLAQEMIKNHI